MYIEPSSDIILLSDVPLDKDYEHTLYFGSANAQATYFRSKALKTVSNSQYQRVHSGVAKVGYKADELYSCNYMMFRNTSFGSKWFYAFVNSVEYINNENSRINFEIDVMQTWYFEAELGECYVEREHVASDNLFENLQPETTGEYDYVSETLLNTSPSEYNAIVLSGTTSGGNPPTPKYIGGIYCPLEVKIIALTENTSELDDYIQSFYGSGSLENIVSVYMYPRYLGDEETSIIPEIVEIECFTNSFDGYVPRNKKLYTYPYMYVEATNHLGQVIDYEFENFGHISEDGTVNFVRTGAIIPNPIMMFYPQNYRGLTDAYDYGISYDKFPQLPWVSDTAKAYMAQHSYSFAYDTVGRTGFALLQMTAGAMMGNPAMIASGTGNFISGFYQVGSTLAKTMDINKAPDKVNNFSSNDTINITSQHCGVTFYRKQLKKEFARMIDDYFTMFGYAVNKIKYPQKRNRELYTYTKTIGCNVTGNVPADDKAKIVSIYDKGITFWSNPEKVGMYGESNNPIG